MMQIKISKATLASAANASREKTGRSASLPPKEIPEEIRRIPSCNKIERGMEWASGKLKTVIFPDGITQIRAHCFRGQSELLITNIPETVTEIGAHAFRDCTSMPLKKLPDGLTDIASGTFFGCENLQITALPDGLKTIGGGFSSGAFETSNISIHIFPKSVESIVAYAFCLCQSMKDIILPPGITTLGYYSFGMCHNLRKVTFTGRNVEAIDTAAFNESGVLEINVPWSEGEVAGAPWGARAATINYNYIYEEDDNGDSDTVPV